MTDTVSLSVKWGKETINLDFVVAGGVKGLKTELEEKTRVPADRMPLLSCVVRDRTTLCNRFRMELEASPRAWFGRTEDLMVLPHESVAMRLETRVRGERNDWGSFLWDQVVVGVVEYAIDWLLYFLIGPQPDPQRSSEPPVGRTR